MKKIFRLGTRGSPLALIQTELVRAELLKKIGSASDEWEIEIVPIRTGGDWKPEMAERTLAEMGANKGFFTKEINEALISGAIDAAVHSVKDMETVLPTVLALTAVLERADPRDGFLSPLYRSIEDLPEGATVGSASLRRRAQVLAKRPDLNMVPLRGNVETRLHKLSEGIAAATFLAKAGLDRLGLTQKITKTLEPDEMLPAVGQGAIGIVTHLYNQDATKMIAALNHAPTSACVTAERALLRVLDGSCKTPIGGLARLASDKLVVLEGFAARPNGTDLVRLQESGSIDDVAAIGEKLGRAIKARFPEGFFEEQSGQ